MTQDKPAGCLAALIKFFQSSDAPEPEASVKANAEVEYPYRRKKYLFSPAERSFFGVLQHVVGDEYHLFAKVRLADLLGIKRGAKSRTGAQNKINMKHVDFVLCDKDNVRPVLVIELDDASHQRRSRQERDAFVNRALGAAGLPIYHQRAQHAYNVQELKEQIQQRALPAGA